MSLEVIKRDGTTVPFDKSKIQVAIEKAMNSATGNYVAGQAEEIAGEIEEFARNIPRAITIYQIEDQVYYSLIKHDNAATARSYENYKAVQSFKRKDNTTDAGIIGLIEATNKDTMDENSNKNAFLAATQRDLIAGEVSKDMARRKIMPTDILQAHDSGAIHYHDLDYAIQPIFNCCLINLEDMLMNGTVINGNQIETPHTFRVACTVTTQIIAQVASNQYGGQSINGFDRILAPFVRKSYLRYLKEVLEEQAEVYGAEATEANRQKAEEIAWRRTRREIKDGVQTVQYQINTLMTTNGQSPFVTLFLYCEPDNEYAKEAAMITEEVLRQRIEGIKNKCGVYVTPAFPKLIYVLDEHNVKPGAPYFYLTELAAECTAKRMYPDYISAKKMREMYDGNVFSPMGCRSFLSPWKNAAGKYVFDGRFNQGVVTINLPQIGILNRHDEEGYFKMLDKRLNIVKKALMLRHERLLNVNSNVSPLHWQYGAIARLGEGEKIRPFLENGYSTLSIGYIGLYEASYLVTGKSHTSPEGKAFALKVMHKLNEAADKWKAETGLGFGVYGTPAESLTHRFCAIDRAHFGDIENVTDKGYYTNSYHVDVREPISVFDKFKFESEFQPLSKGGMISYVEIPNMQNNIQAILEMIQYIYQTIMYAEFNTKLDYCHVCGFSGEIKLDDDNVWTCPQCGNNNRNKLTVVRRTCGYLGSNYWNEGRTKEIKSRVLHI